MAIRYENLDAEVRAFMRQELERDHRSGSVYISPRLTQLGMQVWRNLLGEAIEHHDDNWLAAQLRLRGLIATEEQRRKPRGGYTVVKVPHTAADMLAEGEFNRYYVRGLCAAVLACNQTKVEVYRGKMVTNPRQESEALIGRRLSAQQLLEDLRTSQHLERALGLSPGANSGLTVRRVPQ